MQGITKRDVVAQFERVQKALTRAGDTRAYSLEVWSPGDGKTRYRVDCDGLHVTSYALGRSEAFYMLAAMAEGVERACWAFEERAK